MPPGLPELAAGLPMAASFAMAGGISALREGRRRTALNEAVHELRRPLQAIALTVPESAERVAAFESSLRMAAAAVDRLDREVNGRPVSGASDPVCFRELVEAAVRRWQTSVYSDDRAMSFKWTAGDSYLYGNPVELSQAVDNLISNAVTHGEGEVGVEARQIGQMVRLVVLNRKGAGAAPPRFTVDGLRARISGRARHGHGLRIARRVASRHGGGFRLHDRDGVCEAVLDLPLSGAAA